MSTFLCFLQPIIVLFMLLLLLTVLAQALSILPPKQEVAVGVGLNDKRTTTPLPGRCRIVILANAPGVLYCNRASERSGPSAILNRSEASENLPTDESQSANNE
ncbi:hypothetical protein DFH08DRAFT_814890 [Mycena albidolilacea]|uniref:Secreted protein n=1 Tax=Mycena albidolilacea TaxID=1033008 RepID=A0AAD6ZPW1_9AGAR|nr:hypothetical protein DFH08DRAFT_814890 [Mycena albidolilacea]